MDSQHFARVLSQAPLWTFPPSIPQLPNGVLQRVEQQSTTTRPVYYSYYEKPADNSIASYKDETSKADFAAVGEEKQSGENTATTSYDEEFTKRYLSVSESYADRQKLYHDAINQENKLREAFAQDRTNPQLDDPFLMLIPAHGAHSEAVFAALQMSPEDNEIPKVFPLAPKMRKPAGAPTIVDAASFKRNIDIFTEGQLRNLNWNNVFCAGGSVLACLQPLPIEVGNRPNKIREYYHKTYKSSDVDLFIYELNDEQANAKLVEIYETIRDTVPFEVTAFRSKHAVTLVSQFPYRHIQIVLRLYKSPAEVLMGFDVDSCSVGYNGRDVWMTPRCQRSLVHQCNFIDMSRRSPSYEMRLAKYSDRGFSVAVPTLKRDRIDPQLFERNFTKLQGLARLLFLERLQTPESRQQFRQAQRKRNLRPQYERQGAYWKRVNNRLSNDPYSQERLQDGGADASDYSCVFLPWGPGWTSRRVRAIMKSKDRILNSRWYAPQKKIHTHPCFFGTIHEVLNDCCGCCPRDPNPDPTSMFVSGPLTWVTVNPGSQSIGSFHPITDGNWSDGAYITTITERFMDAIKENNVDLVHSLINDSADLECNDALGRTPLIVSALCNSVGACEALLSAGSNVLRRTSDGKTALHIAAANGYSELLQLVIDYGEKQREKHEQEQQEREDDEEACNGEEAVDVFDIDAEDWDAKMTPLQLAVFFGHKHCVQLLLDAGASITNTVEQAKLVNENASFGSYNNNNQQLNYSILHIAMLTDREDVFQLLLDRGAQADYLDTELESPLFKTVRLNKPKFAKLLLDYFANKGGSKLVFEMLTRLNKKKQTVFTQAIESRDRSELTQLIIEYALALAHKQPIGDCSVFQITEQQIERLSAIVRKMGPIYHGGFFGQKPKFEAYVNQPLFCAVQNADLPLIELILKQEGVDPSVWNESLETPLDYVHNTLSAIDDKIQEQRNNLEQIKTCEQRLADTSATEKREYSDFERWILNKEYSNVDLLRNRTAKAPIRRNWLTPSFVVESDAGLRNAQKQIAESRIAMSELLKQKLLRIADLLRARNAQRFVDLTLARNVSAALIEHQNQLKASEMTKRQLLQTNKAVEQSFAAAKVLDPVFSMDKYRLLDNDRKDIAVPSDQRSRYHELFLAAFAGDIAEIERLTIHAAANKQQPVFVCSRLMSDELAPVDVALLRGFFECAFRLLEIAALQFEDAVVIKKKTSVKQSVPTINNYALTNFNDFDYDNDDEYNNDYENDEEPIIDNVNQLMEQANEEALQIKEKINVHPIVLLHSKYAMKYIMLNCLQSDTEKARFLERVLVFCDSLPRIQRSSLLLFSRFGPEIALLPPTALIPIESSPLKYAHRYGLIECTKLLLRHCVTFIDCNVLLSIAPKLNSYSGLRNEPKENYYNSQKTFELASAVQFRVRKAFESALRYHHTHIVDLLFTEEAQELLKSFCVNFLTDVTKHRFATTTDSSHEPSNVSSSESETATLVAQSYEYNRAFFDLYDLDTKSEGTSAENPAAVNSLIITALQRTAVSVLRHLIDRYVKNQPERVRLLLNDRRNNNLALHLAIVAMQNKSDQKLRSDTIEMMRLLLDAGANPFIRDRTPSKRNALHLAVESDCLEIVQLLVEYSREHIEPMRKQQRNKFGRLRDTPLVNTVNAANQTPLILAIKGVKQLALVQYLMQQSETSLAIRDWNGEYALHHASKYGFAEIVKQILNKNTEASNNSVADVGLTAESFFGKTPLDLAMMLYNQLVHDQSNLHLYNYNSNSNSNDSEDAVYRLQEAFTKCRSVSVESFCNGIGMPLFLVLAEEHISEIIGHLQRIHECNVALGNDTGGFMLSNIKPPIGTANDLKCEFAVSLSLLRDATADQCHRRRLAETTRVRRAIDRAVAEANTAVTTSVLPRSAADTTLNDDCVVAYDGEGEGEGEEENSFATNE